jgi:hypothetical protein
MSGRTGLPTKAACRAAGKLPGNPSATRAATRASQRLVSPATAFCSWITSGVPMSQAAMPPGPDAKPPQPSTTPGRRRRSAARAWRTARSIVKGPSSQPFAPLPRRPATSIHSTG